MCKETASWRVKPAMLSPPDEVAEIGGLGVAVAGEALRFVEDIEIGNHVADES